MRPSFSAIALSLVFTVTAASCGSESADAGAADTAGPGTADVSTADGSGDDAALDDAMAEDTSVLPDATGLEDVATDTEGPKEILTGPEVQSPKDTVNVPDVPDVPQVDVPDVCTPSCTGKFCGDDGCGGSCGGCIEGYFCNTAGQCEASPILNGCGAAEDAAILCSTDVLETTADCGFQCALAPANCTTCITAASGLSATCSACYGALYGCAASKCPFQCFDAASAACVDCVATSCKPALDTCAGEVVCPCVPSCAGKTCEADGCGGTCNECPDGLSCDATGVCAACGPCPTGTVCGGDPDSPGYCTGSDCGAVTEAGECSEDGRFHRSCSVGGTLYSYDCGGLTGGAKACVVDSATNTAECVPVANCKGKQCGDDGVGGVCGVCADEFICSASQQCVDPTAACGLCAPGLTCDVQTGHCIGGACGELPAAGQCAGDAWLTCVNDVLESTDCGFESSGANECAFDVGAEAYACVPKGDCAGKACGWNGASGVCGACPVGSGCDALGQCVDASTSSGETCQNPLSIQNVPFVTAGDTAGRLDGYWTADACPGPGPHLGLGLPDLAYQFTPATTGAYTLTLAPVLAGAASPSLVYVTTDCEALATSCVAVSAPSAAGGAVTLTTTLTAGVTYFVIVDGRAAGDAGPYTLGITL